MPNWLTADGRASIASAGSPEGHWHANTGHSRPTRWAGGEPAAMPDRYEPIRCTPMRQRSYRAPLRIRTQIRVRRLARFQNTGSESDPNPNTVRINPDPHIMFRNQFQTQDRLRSLNLIRTRKVSEPDPYPWQWFGAPENKSAVRVRH